MYKKLIISSFFLLVHSIGYSQCNTVGAASSSPTLCVNTPLTPINHTTTGATGIGIASGLPAGLTATWASNTITISGTPTASGSFTYSIPLTGGCGTVNASGIITVRASSAWLPSDLGASLALWLDASDPATITQSGGFVSQWNDKSSNGRNFSQGNGTYQPAYSNPNINLDGSNDGIMRTSGNFGYGTGDFAILAVVKPTARNTTYGSEIVAQHRFAVDADFIFHILPSGELRYRRGGGVTVVTSSGTVALNTNSVVSVSRTSNNYALHINGMQDGTSVDANSIGNLNTPTGIGVSNNYHAGSAFSGQINEVIIVPSTLTPSDREKLEGYLAHKWGLTANLPSVHDYKSSAPTFVTATTSGAASSSPTLCVNTPLTPITHTTTGATGIGTASGLPAGLTATWASNTITISGTPTASGSFTYSIPLTGGCGTVNASGIITVRASSAWLPSDLGASVKLWLDATDAATITQSGGFVSQWNDKSGNGNHFQSTGTSQPTYQSNAINSNAAIDFDGSSDYMSAGDKLDLRTNELTIMTVVKYDNTNTGGAIVGKSLYGPGVGRYALLRLNSGDVFGTSANQYNDMLMDINITANAKNSTPETSTDPKIIGGTINRVGTSYATLYENGTSTATSSSGAADNTDYNTSHALMIGAYQNGSGTTPPQASSYLDGKIAEIIICSSLLDNLTRQKLEGYLAHKWGLTANLPSVHDYKSSAPTFVTATTSGAASSSPTLCVNTPLTPITHTTTGATGIGTASGLPAGLTATWASNNITISGTPTALGSFTYSIPLTGGCGTVNASGIITVVGLPTITASSGGARGTTAKASIQATSSAGSINWYTAPSGGSALGTSNSGVNWTTPSIASTTTYYAEAVIGSCVSTARTSVSATVSDALVIIGKENSSSFLQKQSNNTTDSLRAFVSTYAASNAANSGSITNDVSYISIANNGGKLKATATSNAEKPSGIYSRFEREWQITNTNFSDNFSLEIQWLTSGNVTLSDLRLLVDSDGDFSNATAYSATDGLTFEIGSIIVRGINTTMIPSGSTRFITIGSISSSTPLPIELLSFKAALKGNEVALSWQTANENNNNYFAIQRSGETIDWEAIDTVKGAGNSSTVLNYAYTDEKPLVGTSYYRLKQVDFDNRFSYSDIAVVNFEGIKIVDLFPNPSEGNFNLVMKSSIEASIDLTIYNAIGQMIKTQAMQITKGVNTLHAQFEAANGKYLITVKSTDGAYYDYTVVLNK